MSLKKILAAAGVTLAMTATAGLAADPLPSSDDTFEVYSQVEGWTIFVDETNATCLIEKTDENANVVQVGLTKDKKYAYVGVFTKADVGIKNHKEKILVSVDGNLYEGKAKTKTKHLPEGYTGGYFLADNANFISDFQKKYTMTVFPKKENAFIVSLDGTLKAVEAGRECVAAQGS